MYSVSFSAQALAFLEAADPREREQVLSHGEQLAKDPYCHPDISPLKGELSGYYRFQMETIWAIYRVEEQSQDVIVLQLYVMAISTAAAAMSDEESRP